MNMPLFRTLALALLPLSGSLAGVPAAETLPAAIVAPGETLVLATHAEGAQVYECKAGSDGKLAWTFREPIATLMADGSAVTGKAIGNAPGATPSDIPWLKLEVISHRGNGTFSAVTTVQRINTQ